MPGPPRKPSSERKGHRSYNVTTLAAVPDAEPPVKPDLPDASDMLPVTRAAWGDLWSSQIAKTNGVLLPESDLPALVRLFHMRDEYERTMDGYRAERLVEGSQGQMVISPLFTAAQSLAKEIRALEQAFGLSPIARLRMSIELGEATKSLDDLNDRMAAKQGPIGGDGDHVEVIDPRIKPA